MSRSRSASALGDRAGQRGFGLHRDAGEALGQRVVDLRREALPLRDHPGLVVGRRELVLCRGQLVEQGCAFAALVDEPQDVEPQHDAEDGADDERRCGVAPVGRGARSTEGRPRAEATASASVASTPSRARSASSQHCGKSTNSRTAGAGHHPRREQADHRREAEVGPAARGVAVAGAVDAEDRVADTQHQEEPGTRQRRHPPVPPGTSARRTTSGGGRSSRARRAATRPRPTWGRRSRRPRSGCSPGSPSLSG